MVDAALPSVIAQSPDQIEAAVTAGLAVGKPLRIFTAPWLVAGYGVLGLPQVGRGACEVVLDCGADAGTVMAGLRSGWKNIAFAGRPAVRRKLAEIAEQAGASLIEPPEMPSLILQPNDDAAARVRAWLAGRPDRGSPGGGGEGRET